MLCEGTHSVLQMLCAGAAASAVMQPSVCITVHCLHPLGVTVSKSGPAAHEQGQHGREVHVCLGANDADASTVRGCRFAEKMMKVVVNAKKNKGGLSTVHGNKVKLDPTVLAIMEKRVQDGIAAARAELMAQYGGGPMGGGMSDEEKAELEELRMKVAGLGKEQQVRRCPLCSGFTVGRHEAGAGKAHSRPRTRLRGRWEQGAGSISPRQTSDSQLARSCGTHLPVRTGCGGTPGRC